VRRYTLFGEDLINVTNGSGYETEHRFTGQIKDLESGLYRFQARPYWAEGGFFPTTDNDWRKSPHQSSYVYCSNDPINRIDPDGNFDIPAAIKRYLANKATQAVSNLTKAAAVATVGLAKAYVEKKLDNAVNSGNTFATSVAMTAEFFAGIGPETRQFGQDHPFTQSLMQSNFTTEALKAFQKGYDNGNIIKEYMVNFNAFYPLSGDTGPFKEMFKDGFTAAQFTGSATYNFNIQDDMLNITVYDTKTEWSALYHAPGTDRHTRSEKRIMGETTQIYRFSIPLTEVKQRANE